MSNLHATEPLLYTYQQAADKLGLGTVQALRDLVYRGAGPVAIRIGSRVFFAPADLRDWVDAHRDLPAKGDVDPTGTVAPSARRRGRPSIKDRVQRGVEQRGNAR